MYSTKKEEDKNFYISHHQYHIYDCPSVSKMGKGAFANMV